MTTSEQEQITASDLDAALRVAEGWLAANRDAVNAINVYPVPDGDTGTNMLLTLRAALQAADEAGSATAEAGVGGYTAAVAEGALLGARGNSGVILSQMLRGLAEGLAGEQATGVRGLCAALVSAARAADEAVGDPVEGTMLTVMRDAARAGAAAAEAGGTLAEALDGAVTEAEASLERTPELLPRLREAGVVDAGGMGIVVLLLGLHSGLTGAPLPAPAQVATGAVELASVAHEGHGYCTEYIVLGDALDRGALEGALRDIGGESLLVVGDAHALHIHVHAADPGPAISLGAGAGALAGVKVENMQAQHEQWAQGHRLAGGPPAPGAEAAEPPSLGLVAVAAGPGLAAAFRDLGATAIVESGPTFNPSAGELLEAARGAAREHVFLLPNDGNVLLAAEQAAAQEPGFITVIPARSTPAGLAAALGYAPEGEREEVREQMEAQLAGVRTIEVTRAVRDSSADGVEVAAGDPIALVDGRLVERAASLEEALLAALGPLAAAASLVTIYLGEGADIASGPAVQRLIVDAHSHLEVEVLPGGQPHYPYLASVE
jgi:DAK2 domain fusion protein YloV